MMARFRMYACADGTIASEDFRAADQEQAEIAAAEWIIDNWHISRPDVADSDLFAEIAGELDGFAVDPVEEAMAEEVIRTADDMPKPLIELLAAHYAALATVQGGWRDYHLEAIEELVKEHMPSGSGFDAGTEFMIDESRLDRLIFKTSFHHMNEGGFYDGWTEHRVIVTPSFIGGFDVRVTGRDKRAIKDYIGDTFADMLAAKVRAADMDRPEHSD